MERIVERSVLFDFYGNLLTEHQRKIYEDIVNNDYSLSEIGEAMGISRQGVHDIVKRIDKILAEYEDKLHFVENYNKNLETIDKIKSVISEIKDGKDEIDYLEGLVESLEEGM